MAGPIWRRMARAWALFGFGNNWPPTPLAQAAGAFALLVSFGMVCHAASGQFLAGAGYVEEVRENGGKWLPRGAAVWPSSCSMD